MTRYLPIALFAALFTVLAYGLAHVDDVQAPETSPMMGKPLPDLALSSFTGDDTFSATGSKHTVQIVNIFASWCMPCIAELPELAPMRQIEGVSLVGIAWHDAPEALRAWVKKHNAPYDKIYRDMDNQTGVKLGIRGVPETFIVDHEGIVRYHHVGPVDAYTRDTVLMPLLRELTS